jgi:predicted lactoylglutathione lyase
MTKVPNRTEVARPFLPAKDFALSQRFYEALGFEKSHHNKTWRFSQSARAASFCRII